MSVIEDLLLRLRATGWKEGAAEVDATTGAIRKSEVAADEASASHAKLGKAFGGLKTAALGTAGIVGLTGAAVGIGQAIAQTEKLQQAQQLLGKTIKSNVHKPAADATEQLTSAADTLSTRGGFDPTTAIGGLTTLVRATGSVTKAQKDLSLATDLARGGQMDLGRATRSVALIEQGHTAGLTRLGIVLPTVTTAQDKLTASSKTATVAQKAQAKALDVAATRTEDLRVLTKKFGGDTQTYSRSAQGAISNLGNEIEILSTRLGKVLLPIIGTVAGAIGQFVHQMMSGKGAGGQFVDVLKGMFSALKQIFNVIKPLLPLIAGATAAWAAYRVVTAATAIVQGLLDAALVSTVGELIAMIPTVASASDALALMGLAMDAIPIVGWISAIGAAVVGLIMLYKHVKVFRDAVQAVFHWIKNNWPLLADILLGPFGLIVGEIVQHFSTIKKAATDAAQWIVNAFNNVVQFFSKLPSRLASAGASMWNWIKTAFQNVLAWIMGAWNSLLDKMNIDIGPIHIHPGASLKFSQSSIATTKFGKSPVRAIGGGQGAPPILVGSRQSGGPVWRGGNYLVGERGPEVVTLPAGSNVTPNEQLHRERDQRPIILYNVLDGKILSQSIVRQGMLQQSRGG
jgi:hypothetical protein